MSSKVYLCFILSSIPPHTIAREVISMQERKAPEVFSMQKRSLEYRVQIGRAAYVHPVTYICYSRALIGQAEECLRFMSYVY